MNTAIDRRSLIGLAGTAAAGMVTGTALADEAAPDWMPAWDDEADVVIVGYGAAGGTAALNADDLGLSVIMLEAAPEGEAGGETCISGGFVVPNPGGADPAQMNVEDYKVSCMGIVDDGYIEQLIPYLNEAAANVTALGVVLDTESMPGYAFATGAEAGCAGWALYEAIDAAVKARPQIDVRYECPGIGLVQDPFTKEALGIKAGTEEAPIYIKAKRGVILSTGGYEGDSEMIRDIFANGVAKLPTVSSPYNTGEGYKMLAAAGARITNFDHCLEFCNPSFKVASEEVGTGLVIGQGLGAVEQLFTPGLIYVNKEGKRFCDESIDLIHQKTTSKLPMMDYQGDPWSNQTNSGFVNMPAWVVFDEATRLSGPIARRTGAGGWGWNTGYPGKHNLWVWSDDNSVELEKGWLFKADTLEELAEMCVATDVFGNEVKMDAAGLVEEVARYNAFCEAGEDEDFHTASDWLVPLAEGPYYAAEIVITTLYTTGGPLVEAGTCLAVDWKGNAIPRLHAAGEVASVSNLHSPSLVGAIATGRISAEDVAKTEPWA